MQRIPVIPERLLRTIWQQQKFATSSIRTSDGRPVTIVSPGVPNHDGGPDFANARIRIGSVTYIGDVELHQSSADWLGHRHESDPHYNRVILHVVISAEKIGPAIQTASHRPVPLLVLHPFLDETLHTTLDATVLDGESARGRPIRCYASNDRVSVETMMSWIGQLACERIELKVRRFEERLKQLSDERNAVVREPYPRYYGNPEEIPLPKKEYTKKDLSAKVLWEQLLYEGIMEALGYSKNRRPFIALAQSMRLDMLRRYPLTDIQTMMALLFGAAGLLPSSRLLEEKESRAYIRPLRRRWKNLKPLFRGAVLHEADWLFFRLRPSNFPTARLAAFCTMLPSLFGQESFRDLISMFSDTTISPQKCIHSLHLLFHIEPDEFWRHHVHFRRRKKGSGFTFGAARTNDILVNVITPIVMLYARVFNRQSIRTAVREVLIRIPASQGNSNTRKMEQELLKDKGCLDSAFAQQGAIQLLTLYCLPERCLECPIGHEALCNL